MVEPLLFPAHTETLEVTSVTAEDKVTVLPVVQESVHTTTHVGAWHYL